MGAFLMLFFFTFGLLSWRLHYLPEHIAHTGQELQYQVVASTCFG